MLKSPEKIKQKVLIAPLDWGLGHATRMMPIIRTFLEKNWSVELASGGQSYDLLKNRFPELNIYRIPSYNIRYTKNSLLMLKLFAQAPSMYKGLKAEHDWLKTYVENNSPDLIISDDRFGMFHEDVQSWYVTHQIRVLMPWYLKPAQPFVRFLHKQIIKKYDKCLVPDVQFNGLSGLLAHKRKGFQFMVEYTGILSRFHNVTPVIPENPPDVLAVISGPEPQRSILIEKLKTLYKDFVGTAVIVSGRPEKDEMETCGSVKIFSHMQADKLSGLMKSAPVLICRSGYSTLMDLFFLERKAILIPTPGQTEQIYLGKYFQKKFGFQTIHQSELKTTELLKESLCGDWKHPEIRADLSWIK